MKTQHKASSLRFVTCALASLPLLAQAAPGAGPPFGGVPAPKASKGWQGLPMKCDGTEQTVRFVSSKGAALELVLKMASPTATSLQIVRTSQTVEGEAVKANNGIATLWIKAPSKPGAYPNVTLLGGENRKPSNDARIPTSTFTSKLQVSSTAQLSIPSGSYSFDCSSWAPKNCLNEQFTAPAAALCQ